MTKGQGTTPATCQNKQMTDSRLSSFYISSWHAMVKGRGLGSCKVSMEPHLKVKCVKTYYLPWDIRSNIRNNLAYYAFFCF